MFRSDILVPPSPLPLNLSRVPDPALPSYSHNQQDILLDTLLFRGLERGFFLEAGADDFVLGSNTLLLELRQVHNSILTAVLAVKVHPPQTKWRWDCVCRFEGGTGRDCWWRRTPPAPRSACSPTVPSAAANGIAMIPSYILVLAFALSLLSIKICKGFIPHSLPLLQP